MYKVQSQPPVISAKHPLLKRRYFRSSCNTRWLTLGRRRSNSFVISKVRARLECDSLAVYRHITAHSTINERQ